MGHGACFNGRASVLNLDLSIDMLEQRSGVTQQSPPLQRFLSSEEANGLPLSKSARSCYVIFCIVLYVFFIVCCLSCSVCVVVYIICILLYLSLFPSVQCSSRQFSGVGFSPLFEVSPVFQLFVDHKISVQSSFSVGLMSRPVKLYLSVQSDSCIFV